MLTRSKTVLEKTFKDIDKDKAIIQGKIWQGKDKFLSVHMHPNQWNLLFDLPTARKLGKHLLKICDKLEGKADGKKKT